MKAALSGPLGLLSIDSCQVLCMVHVENAMWKATGDDGLPEHMRRRRVSSTEASKTHWELVAAGVVPASALQSKTTNRPYKFGCLPQLSQGLIDEYPAKILPFE
jgi:hypothetical protein